MLAIFLIILYLFIGFGTGGIGLIVLPLLYLILVVQGSEARATRVQQKLSGTLMKEEKVIETALQKRVASLFSRRQFIAITSSRIITLNRSWFGSLTMRDYQWKDLDDAQLQERVLSNIFGSKLIFAVGDDQGQLLINGIPNDVAARIYSHSQSEEQAWEEKRRIRSLEEIRAASGGFTIASGMSQGTGSSGSVSIVDELGKAKALLDSGNISDAEYNELKARILSR